MIAGRLYGLSMERRGNRFRVVSRFGFPRFAWREPGFGPGRFGSARDRPVKGFAGGALTLGRTAVPARFFRRAGRAG